MERAGAHLHVVGLQDHAALLGPELLQGQDQPLEGSRGAERRGFARHEGPCEAGEPFKVEVSRVKPDAGSTTEWNVLAGHAFRQQLSSKSEGAATHGGRARLARWSGHAKAPPLPI